MKSSAVAVIVAGAFLAGIGVGAILMQSEPSAGKGGGGQASLPRVDPTPPTGWAPDGSQHTGKQEAGSVAEEPAGKEVGVVSKQDPNQDPLASGPGIPPPTPPAPPPLALKEGEKVRKELATAPKRGGGKITPLIYKFDSEAKRKAWEEGKRANWKKRLEFENDIRIRQLREKIGLSAAQEGTLRQILADELGERLRLTDELVAQRISNTSFDEGVQANVASAKGKLTELLTSEQLEVYKGLKPREQVLRDEVK